MSDFLKIQPWELSWSMRADRQTDRQSDGQTDMTKLTIDFRNVVNTSKN